MTDKLKCSPGEWRWDRKLSDHGAPMIVSERGWTGTPRPVAKVLFHGGSEDPEVHANAHLVEQAKNLYRELEGAAGEFEDLAEPGQGATRDFFRMKASRYRRTLAKARGESP